MLFWRHLLVCSDLRGGNEERAETMVKCGGSLVGVDECFVLTFFAGRCLRWGV